MLALIIAEGTLSYQCAVVVLVTREEIQAHSPEREDAPAEFTIKRFRARDDIQEAMNTIAYCHDRNLAIEAEGDYWLNLKGADLKGADLLAMNLSRAPIGYQKSTSVYQQLAIGRHTDMRGAKMDDARLLAAKLSRVDLSHATGLTQDQLDSARADPKDVPKLDGVIDAITRKPIVWNRSAAKDE